ASPQVARIPSATAGASPRSWVASATIARRSVARAASNRKMRRYSVVAMPDVPMAIDWLGRIRAAASTARKRIATPTGVAIRGRALSATTAIAPRPVRSRNGSRLIRSSDDVADLLLDRVGIRFAPARAAPLEREVERARSVGERGAGQGRDRARDDDEGRGGHQLLELVGRAAEADADQQRAIDHHQGAGADAEHVDARHRR